MNSLRYVGYRSFEPEYETMKELRKRGIDTVTIMVSNNTNFMGSPYTRYQPTWIWNREYDFTLFDQNIKDVTEAVPDVKLNVVLDLNPPSWWMPRLAGRDAFNEFGRLALLESQLQKTFGIHRTHRIHRRQPALLCRRKADNAGCVYSFPMNALETSPCI